jgi:putative glutamine amidotransferase
MVIAVSKLKPNYETWLRKLHKGIEIVDLYSLPLNEVLNQVPNFSGILLSGGSDIHPGMYGRGEDLPFCQNIDEMRDFIEKALIERAFQHKIPLLGICRGQQVLNVVMKGTLFADIPAFCNSTIVHSGEKDVYHTIRIRKGSLLNKLSGLTEGMVNSAHHQAVCAVAPDFKVSAYSEDRLIEAIEAGDTINHPFCLAVQWHPERMDLDNPLSGMIGKAFIEAGIKQQH